MTDEEVAALVEERKGSLIVGWPYNGTRRWYTARIVREDFADDYIVTLIRRQAEHHRMLFAHGVSTLLVPSFGNKNLSRGPEYSKRALQGILRLGEDPVYRQMIEGGLRIRFYGDYERVIPERLGERDGARILQGCRDLTEKTSNGSGPLLLIGLFADEPYASIALLSVDFYKEYGRPPVHSELIERYYGSALSSLDIYIGFAKPQLFDVPLLTDGSEQLYVTMNPSPDLSRVQFRTMLYDYLFRRGAEPHYSTLSNEKLEKFTEQLEASSGQTFGVGRIDPLTGGWIPQLPKEDDSGKSD